MFAKSLEISTILSYHEQRRRELSTVIGRAEHYTLLSYNTIGGYSLSPTYFITKTETQNFAAVLITFTFPILSMNNSYIKTVRPSNLITSHACSRGEGALVLHMVFSQCS